MKQFFAIFCAFVLLPMFTTQAWVGGPFSNNNYLGGDADDGVYEAVASAVNGIGLYRIVVGNEFAGSSSINFTGIGSGNVVIGAFGTATNTWFYQGVYYIGTTIGTANSAIGVVQATASATGPAFEDLSSVFRARFDRSSELLPASAFSGTGRAVAPNGRFRFSVFGTKVSDNILFGI